MENQLLEIRAMKWSEYCRFMEEIVEKRPARDDKGLFIDAKTTNEQFIMLNKSMRTTGEWIFKNVYPEFNIEEYTPNEIIAIGVATEKASNVVRNDELKNLERYLIGSSVPPTTAKAAPDETEKPTSL